MEGNAQTGFVSLENIVSEVLMRIDDMEQKRYQAMALQFSLNAIRDVNVFATSTYEEVPVELDADLRTGDYPADLVRALSVGVYKNGEFWSFTNTPDMAITMTEGDGTPDTEFGENASIPQRGIRFGARGSNIGYWKRDDKNRRFAVRNYTQSKVILRYRSNGLGCTTRTCVPYDAKDLVVAKCVLEFAMMGRPRRFSGAEIQLLVQNHDNIVDRYTDLHYVPQNFDEFRDAEFASFNNTVRRG
ncbi:MAG: hypothetical protein JXR54_09970 [Tannerellaceae bacterium]|nr:hypothetical protein [Tannerellaceae bacterium]